MSAEGDSLKIPIEIKTEDLDEIRELINDISQAENDLRSLKATPRKGRGSGDTESRSAFTSPEPRDEGIFGGARTGEALPTKGRDTKSATPFQRESEFAKLKNQVNEVEQRQGGPFDAVQSGLGGATQAVGFAQLLGGGAGGILGGVAGAASKAFLPLAVITTIISVVKGVLDQALAPGGPLDRRFKRVIGTEIANANSLETKQALNQGMKVIRTQVYPGLRGEAGTSSSLRNKPNYDLGIANNMVGLP